VPEARKPPSSSALLGIRANSDAVPLQARSSEDTAQKALDRKAASDLAHYSGTYDGRGISVSRLFRSAEFATLKTRSRKLAHYRSANELKVGVSTLCRQQNQRHVEIVRARGLRMLGDRRWALRNDRRSLNGFGAQVA
jgi:hypothetical protein